MTYSKSGRKNNDMDDKKAVLLEVKDIIENCYSIEEVEIKWEKRGNLNADPYWPCLHCDNKSRYGITYIYITSGCICMTVHGLSVQSRIHLSDPDSLDGSRIIDEFNRLLYDE